MTQVNKFAKTMKDLLVSGRFKKMVARLGNLQGVIQEKASNVWVTLLDGEELIVRNDRVPNYVQWVWIGHDEQKPDLLQVLSSINAYQAALLPSIPDHDHSWGKSTNPSWIRGEQFMPGLALPIGGMVIQFYGLAYYLGGYHILGMQEIDLTANIPGSGAVWGILEVNTAGVISVLTGASVETREMLEYENIPIPSTAKKPLGWAVKLYQSQSEVAESFNLIERDLVDLRWAGYSSGGISNTVDWTEITNKPTEFPGPGTAGIEGVHIDGSLSAASNVPNAILITNSTRITAWYIHCKDPGTAGSTIVDINKNGTSIFTNQANRPTLAFNDANGWAVSGLPDFIDFAEGDIITFDLDQIAASAEDLKITPLGSVTGGSAIVDGEQGFLVNGKIITSVSSNNLTAAIKTLAGNDPSGDDPVYVRIGNTRRAITSALSVTQNAGTNYFNSGSANLAAFEIDYFVYLGYNATDGIVIGFARIPCARTYGDFSAVSTNDRYAAISTTTNAVSTDEYEVVGRFNAILSAGASYNWSIPAVSIIINRPIYETRWLIYNPTPTGFSAVPTSTKYTYKVRSDTVLIDFSEGVNGTSNATTFTYTMPLSAAAPAITTSWAATYRFFNNGINSSTSGMGRIVSSAPTVMDCWINHATGAWANANGKRIIDMQFSYQIKIG